MDICSAVDIIKIIDGELHLDLDLLRPIISLAENCNKIAIISCIGPKFNGKTFLINCLLNYLENENKIHWPKGSCFEAVHAFPTDYSQKLSSIKMWPKPLFIGEKEQETAVFLMDTSFVFDWDFDIVISEIMQNVVQLFLNICSTVIYTTRLYQSIKSNELKRFQEFIEKLNEYKNSYEEIFFYINDWNAIFNPSKQLFGNKGGNYLRNKVNGFNLDQYFRKCECYLMPSTGKSFSTFEIKFDDFDDTFNYEISKLIKSKLLNIDEMQIKTNKYNNLPIRPNEVIYHFISNINKINGTIAKVEKIKSNSIGNFTKSEHTIILDLEYDLEKKHKKLNNQINSQLENGNKILVEAQSLTDKKVFEDSAENYHSNALFGTNQQNQNDIKDETNEEGETRDMDTSQLSDSKNTIENDKDSEMMDISNDENNELDESFNHMTDKFEAMLKSRCYYLYNSYKTAIETGLNNTNSDLTKSLLKLHNDEKSKAMTAFDETSKISESNSNISDYRIQLSNQINTIKEVFEEEVKERICKIKVAYNRIAEDCLKYYEQKMRDSIQNEINCENYYINIVQIHSNNKKLSTKKFNALTTIDDIKKEYYNELIKQMNLKKSKYQSCSSIIAEYRNDWHRYFNNYRYINPLQLIEIQKELINKYLLLMEDDHLLKNILHKTFINIFEKIKTRNEEIDKLENEVADETVEFVKGLYNKSLVNKLKSGLYSESELNIMNQNLLDYTLNIVNKELDFKEYQQYLVSKMDNNLRSELINIFTKIKVQHSKIKEKSRKVIQNAIEDSMKQYVSYINNAFANKKYFKISEFEELHSNTLNESLKLNQSHMEEIKKYFDLDFFKAIINKNSDEIESKINSKKMMYIKLNEKNTPVVKCIAIYLGRRYLSAAHYDKEVHFILDKYEQKRRPNSIAFSDNILFGTEAKSYYESIYYSNSEIHRTFDLKILLDRNPKSISYQELSKYPFEIFESTSGLLLIKVEKKIVEHYFPIVSLISLQVLDIRMDAEKQLKNVVKNAVITLPTFYTIRNKDTVKDMARIAGLEEMKILTEMTATVIGYYISSKRIYNNVDNLFIIVLNEYDCDAGICTLKDFKIEYKSYSYKNLASEVETSHFFKEKWKTLRSYLFSSTVKSENDLFIKSVEKLLTKTLQVAGIERNKINRAIISGDSLLIKFIKEYMIEYFGTNAFYNCDPIDIIINGSAYYSNNLFDNLSTKIDIREIAFYDYSFTLKGKFDYEKKITMAKRNTLLPCSMAQNFHAPRINDLPVELAISQDNLLIRLYHINQIPRLKNFEEWYTNQVKYNIDEFGDIKIISNLITKNKNWFELELNELKFGLKETEIIEETKILAMIEQKFKDHFESIEKNNSIKIETQGLEKYYLEVKKLVESKPELSRIKKKKLLTELDQTMVVLQSNNLELTSILKQKESLQNTVRVLIK